MQEEQNHNLFYIFQEEAMKCELISVETRDRVVLHGAFFEGELRKPAVIILHGAAMNFYTGVGRFMPEIYTRNLESARLRLPKRQPPRA